CQADDGIRDKLVTGVQTCALPISEEIVDHHARQRRFDLRLERLHGPANVLVGEVATVVERGEPLERRRCDPDASAGLQHAQRLRSEERRVGKGCRVGWVQYWYT